MKTFNDLEFNSFPPIDGMDIRDGVYAKEG